jgi:dynein intermediate chain 1
VFTFDLNEIVADVAWAPYSSTVFAAITSNGYVYFYDLAVDTYEPLCVQNVFNAHKRKRHLTHLAFNPQHPILVITDNKL